MIDTTKIGMSTNFDQDIWDETTTAIKNGNLQTRDIIDNYILFLRRVNFARYLAHIDIFKMTVDLPGSVVELGVFKGQSLLTFTKMIEILCPGDTLKKVIGFDTFEGFPALTNEDGKENAARDLVVGGFNSEDFLPTLEQMIEITQKDSMIPRFKRVELVKGDACETIPKYIEENPGLRISLLHLDLDIYQPTKVALEQLYPLVVPGGVILLDEYAMPGFPGESKAFDEYFGDKRPVVKKFPYISTPGGYFIKEG
jgi:hypothetical protein